MATSLLLLLAARPFLSLYATSTAAKSYALAFIRTLALVNTGTAYQSACLSGLIKAGGDGGFAFRCDLAFLFLAVLPLSVIAMRLSFAPWLILLALKCDQPLKCIVAGIKVNKPNWARPLSQDPTMVH